MIKQVAVELGARSYNINIGTEFELFTDGGGRSALLVSDSNVDPLYGERCSKLLEARGFRVARVVVPAGESTKSLQHAGNLFESAVSAQLDRKSCVVALGGGVVGDLAGFVAGTYLRGVNLIQIPTSLLAMVDSSVGGKTAVNLPQGKNLVGVFYQPLEVVVNLDTLDTLPEREYISGLAEVVKYGVINDAGFFSLLESQVEALRRRDRLVLADVVGRCCEIKADVVAADEREGGLRAILNYGHTLGHAIENSCGYGELLHGEAVALGMVYAGILSVRAAGFAPDDADRIVKLLRALGLPADKSALPVSLDWDVLRRVMSSDKKAEQAVPKFVLACELGRVDFGCHVSEDELETAWRDMA